MEQAKILAEINECATEKEGKKYLKCKDAFAIATKLDVAVAQIGKVCNNEDIKVASCQLGCF